ncbi:MAG: SDR family oxidoreductase [Halobacteriovoraceae bacterium]|nr:SDR family oxidoreductase [Halobacteriovoraceae bacterium]
MKKTILIAGASSGIGENAAIRLAKLGHQVYAGVRKSEDFEKLNNLHENIQALYLDVTESENIKEVAQYIEETCGQLDVLINNAGIVVAGPLELIPVSELNRQFEVNVTAPIAVTQECLPLLRKSKDPRIIFTGSMSGYFTRPFVGPYSASKFAMEAMIDALRVELSDFGIRVSLLEPGTIRTPIWDKSLASANKMVESFDPERIKLYESSLNLVKEGARNARDTGASVDLVGDAMVHAVESSKPKIRYRIGRDAKLSFVLSRIMPFHCRDWLIKKMLAKKRLSTR